MFLHKKQKILSLYNKMKQCSKKEDYKISLDELTKLIDEWNIRERIYEKIEIWGIQFTSKKIQQIPIKFISCAILYYIVSQFKYSILNYTQDLLMSVSFQLRCIYNSLSIKIFKKTSYFEFTIIVLAKLTRYFLTSRFAHLPLAEDEIQKKIYSSMVNLLLGYAVDSNAYEIILNKEMKKKKGKLSKHPSYRLINENREESVEKGNRSTKKLHRVGIHTLFQNNQEDKNVETFRLEVHEALKIKKKTIFRDESKQQLRKKTSLIEDGTKSTDWLKGKDKVMNINQLSAAMSIYAGFDLQNKSGSNVHLSKRRKIRQYYFEGIQLKQSDKEKVTAFNEVSQNASKTKDWTLILSELKQKSEHLAINQRRDSSKQTHLANKSAYKSIFKLESNKVSLNNSVYGAQENTGFRKINKKDFTFYYNREDNIQTDLKKSNSSFFGNNDQKSPRFPQLFKK